MGLVLGSFLAQRDESQEGASSLSPHVSQNMDSLFLINERLIKIIYII